MSLINDALKRASQSERNRPREASLPAPMQPALESRRSMRPLFMGVAALLLLAAAGCLIWRSLASRTASAPAPIAAAPVRIVSQPDPPVATPVAKAEPVPAPVATPPPVVVTAPPALVPVPAVAVAAPFPDLTIQGIFYSRRNPRVIINGKSLGEDEQIGEVRVLKITETRVTVQWNGQSKELRWEGR